MNTDLKDILVYNIDWGMCDYSDFKWGGRGEYSKEHLETLGYVFLDGEWILWNPKKISIQKMYSISLTTKPRKFQICAERLLLDTRKHKLMILGI
jgi:hypothetical protein